MVYSYVGVEIFEFGKLQCKATVADLLNVLDAIFDLVGGKNHIQLVRVLQLEVKPGKNEARIVVLILMLILSVFCFSYWT